MSRQPFDPIISETKPEEIFDILVARSKVDLKQVDQKIIWSLIKSKTEHKVDHVMLEHIETKPIIEQKIKFGIDPTGAEIHLGHLVPMMLLKIFARANARVDFVIGDFTAKIGDPSGREHAREPLSSDQIKNNLESYIKQIKPYFDLESFKNVKIHHNSQWLESFSISSLLRLLQDIPLSALTQREDIKIRLEAGKPVSFAESLYPVFMGLDSAQLDTTIEIGGRDQELNFWLCRHVQLSVGRNNKKTRFEVESGLCTPILQGTSGDGKKMSKSLNNYISISTSAENIFGLTMSIPDSHIYPWIKSFGDVLGNHDVAVLPNPLLDSNLENLVNIYPLELKKQLAMYLVYLGHGEDQARIERDSYERKFSKKIITDEDYISVKLKEDKNIVEALKQAQPDWSKTHIKQLLISGAVKLMNHSEAVLTENYTVSVGDKLKVGKLAYFKFE